MTDQQILLLEQFVNLCQTDPSILHQPKMAFYKQYLESLGATVPPLRGKEHKCDDKRDNDEEEQTKNVSEDEYEREDWEEPEIDFAGVIPRDNDPPLEMGDPSREVTDEDIQKANENRDLANQSFSDGDYEAAVQFYTKSIELNPNSAILHAKRASVLIKLSKPVAAIRDCDFAISINPDNAQGYKFRGRANRLLGKWLEAYSDLAIACKLDFDEVAYEWLKEVEPNAKKIQDYNRAKDRKFQERELRDRRRRHEARQKATEQETDFSQSDSGSNEGFGMGAMIELLKEFANDNELLSMVKSNPELIKKLTEIMQNPQNMMKYLDDPDLRKILLKLGPEFGAGAPFTASKNDCKSSSECSPPKTNFADDVD